MLFLHLEVRRMEDNGRKTTRWRQKEYSPGTLCNKKSDIDKKDKEIVKIQELKGKVFYTT